MGTRRNRCFAERSETEWNRALSVSLFQGSTVYTSDSDMAALLHDDAAADGDASDADSDAASGTESDDDSATHDEEAPLAD